MTPHERLESAARAVCETPVNEEATLVERLDALRAALDACEAERAAKVEWTLSNGTHSALLPDGRSLAVISEGSSWVAFLRYPGAHSSFEQTGWHDTIDAAKAAAEAAAGVKR